jgi:uncharacterized integral membrane protein
VARTSGQASDSSSPVKTKRSEARKPTRISWAWGTLILGVLLGIALVDFLVQNTRSVRVEFFSASGQIPIVAALLVAALAGAAVVLVVGAARIGQVRRRGRKDSTSPSHRAGPPASDAPPTDRAA